MPIDTDDLTDETYNAIIIESENFDHNLTLQFGLLSDECDDEADYISKSIKLIEEMLTYDEIEIDDMFFGEPPSKTEFHKALHKILKNISTL